MNFYWEFHERGFEQAIRMGKWKAVRHGLNQPIEPYKDLKPISVSSAI